MKLLLDQNLSYKLAPQLQPLFPGSTQVRLIKLDTADDEAVWNHAKAHGFMITTKDAGFYNRSCLFGHPPKVIWLRVGNCSTQAVMSLLSKHHADILEFEGDPNSGCLELL